MLVLLHCISFEALILTLFSYQLSLLQDNTSLIVWRVDGWKVECKITEPFIRSPETIMFRRPTWSSDGSILIGSAASISGMHVPLLIEREKWTHSYFPVGHKAWVSVTSSNPSVFASSNGGAPYLCYALADVTPVLTVWATNHDSALMAISHCMDKPVTDLRWSHDGSLLLVTSLDGSVMVISFAAGELGRQLSDKEKQARRNATYGSSSGALFEDASLLSIYQEKQQKMQEEAKASAAQQARAAPSAPTKQTETKVNGKRKITPVLVDGNEIRTTAPSDAFKNVFAVGNITPIKSSSNTPTAPSTTDPQPVLSSTSASAPSAAAAAAAARVGTPSQASAMPGVTAADSDSSDSNGKRAKPTATTSSSSEDSDAAQRASAKKSAAPFPMPTSSLFSNTNASSAAGSVTHHNPVAKASSPVTMPPPSSRPFNTPASPPPNGSSLVSLNAGISSPNAGGLSVISQLQTHEIQQKKQRGRGRKPKQTAAAMDVDDDTMAEEDRGIGSGAVGGGGTNLLLPLPALARRFVKKIARGPNSDGTVAGNVVGAEDPLSESLESILEVVITVDDDGIRPPKSVLKYFEGGNVVVWQDHIEDKVTVLTGNTSHVMAAGCQSGDIYIFSPNGRRLFPAINIGNSAICALECLGSTLLAVSTEGVLKMWDVALGIAKADTTLDALMLRHFTVQSERNPLPNVGAGAPLENGASNVPSWYTETEDGSLILNDFVSKFAVSESGQAVCVLQSGQIFGYSTMMASWTCLYAPSWQKDVDKTGLALGQLSSLQRAALRFPTVQASSHSYASYHGLAVEEKRQRTVAHLETQLASAAQFGTSKEYKHFAKLYVRELADLLHEKKLTEFTTSLLGPVNHSLQANASWDPFILGVPKREILEEVLPEMLRPELQRLLITLKEALESANRIANANRQLRSPPMARSAVAKDAPSRALDSTPSSKLGSGVLTSPSAPGLAMNSSLGHVSSAPHRSSTMSHAVGEDETTSDSVASTASRGGNRRNKATSSRQTPTFVIDDEEMSESSQPGLSRGNSKSGKRTASK